MRRRSTSNSATASSTLRKVSLGRVSAAVALVASASLSCFATGAGGAGVGDARTNWLSAAKPGDWLVGGACFCFLDVDGWSPVAVPRLQS